MPRPSSNLHGDSYWTRLVNSPVTASYDTSTGGNFLPLSVTEPGSTDGLSWITTVEQGHGICFAPNRVGKGASVIIPALLSYGGSIFSIDPKGENAWVTAQRRRDLGHRVAILDPFGEVNRVYGEGKPVEQITKFNPLSSLDPSSPNFADDVAGFGEAVIISSAGEKDPFFTDSARELTSGVIALLKELFGDKATMRHVRQLLTDPEALNAAFEEQEEKGGYSLGVEKLRRFVTKPGEEESKTIGAIRSTAITQTAFLDSGPMAEGMEEDGNHFTLSWLLDGNTTIYVVLPPERLTTHGRWLRLITSLALNTITRASAPPKWPHLFLIDEMGTIGALRPLETGFALLAGYGIRFFGFFQTISQLKHDYSKTWQNFIGNCSYIQCLGARDMETAQFVSELLGSQTWVTDDGERKDKRPLMLPNEVMDTLGRDPKHLNMNKQVIVQMQGQRRYLHNQNPYFMQHGWNHKYRQIPWLRGAWPAPPAFTVPPATSTQNVRPENPPPVSQVRRSFMPNKTLLIAAIGVLLLRLALGGMGAAHFHGFSLLGVAYSICGALWPFISLAVIGSSLLNFNKNRVV